MTDPTAGPGSPRSRRRFLADLLFVGGGLTAAGLLAKSRLPGYHPDPPSPGQMVAPTPPPQDPSQAMPGEMMMPEPDGSMEMPQPTPPCEKTENIDPGPVPHPSGAVAPPPRSH